MGSGKLTFAKKIVLSVGVLVVVIAMIAVEGLTGIRRLHSSFEDLSDRSTRGVSLSGDLVSAQADMVAGQRGVFLFGFARDQAHLRDSAELVQKGRARMVQALNDIRPLLNDAKRSQLAASIETNLNEWTANYPEMESLASAGRGDQA